MGFGAGPWVGMPSLMQESSHIYSSHLHKQLTRKKERTQKCDSTPNKSSYCLGLHTQNPRLREADLEPSPKRPSDKINICWNKADRPQKKASCILQPGLTYWYQHLEGLTWNPVLTEEPIEPKLWWAFTDCLEACILKSFSTKSQQNQPR